MSINVCTGKTQQESIDFVFKPSVRVRQHALEDPNSQGRRERLEQRKKRLDVYSEKIGTGSMFEPQKRNAMEAAGLGCVSRISQDFKTRSYAKKGGYGVQVICSHPPILSTNYQKPVGIGAPGIKGKYYFEFYSSRQDRGLVEVPIGYDGEAATIVDQDLQAGTCTLNIPLMPMQSDDKLFPVQNRRDLVSADGKANRSNNTNRSRTFRF